MRNRVIPRLLALATAVGALVAPTACTPAEPPQQGAPMAATRSDASTSTLVIQMSGQLLLVPSDTAGNPLWVILPEDTTHTSWLGFAVNPQAPVPAGLCEGTQGNSAPTYTDTLGQEAQNAGICYVNLREWALDPVGAGGSPAIGARPLPSDLVNVTRLSGNQHIVPRGPQADSARVIKLLAGETSNTCSLATWRMRPFDIGTGSAGDSLRDTLINRLDWRIASAPQKLYFRSRSGPARLDSATLNPGSGGTVRILLVQVPKRELLSLPPWDSAMPPGPRTADHVGPYYHHLRGRGNSGPLGGGSQRRPIPSDAEPIPGTVCDVEISGLARKDIGISSLTSYGCVIGSAEGS